MGGDTGPFWCGVSGAGGAGWGEGMVPGVAVAW